MYTPSITAVCPEHPQGLRTFFCANAKAVKSQTSKENKMTNELEAQQGREELLRAFTPTERIAADSILTCINYKQDLSALIEEVLNEIDQADHIYNTNDPIEHRALLQLQTLDAIFHFSVAKGCKENSNFFKDAFIAQKLFQETSRRLNKKPVFPIPKARTNY